MLLRCFFAIVLLVSLSGAVTIQGPVPTPNPPVALTDGSLIAVTLPYPGQDTAFTLTVTGASHTIQNPSPLVAGQFLNFVITQGGSGGYTLSWGTAYLFPYGSPQLNAGVGTSSVVSCVSISTTQLQCLSVVASGVVNNFFNTTGSTVSLTPNANSLYSQNSNRLAVLNNSFRLQLLKSLH